MRFPQLCSSTRRAESPRFIPGWRGKILTKKRSRVCSTGEPPVNKPIALLASGSRARVCLLALPFLAEAGVPFGHIGLIALRIDERIGSRFQLGIFLLQS